MRSEGMDRGSHLRASSQPEPGTYAALKRCLDCCGAAAGLLVLSPVLVVVALLVALRLGTPVLFRQQRVTKDSAVFALLKFRSMRPVDPARGWIDDEDRLTPFGRFLRATSLDELPSLWNVLVGDMSLIGPRPLTPDYLPRYTAHQARRHTVRAGLSGLAQVSGRNSLSWDDKFDLDVAYVEEMSWGLDCRILLRTVTTVLSRRGVAKDPSTTTHSYGGTLRSELVRFHPVEAPAPRGTWVVRTLDGERIGRCELTALDPETAEIGCDWADVGFGHDREELHAEALRLLLNRARGIDVSHVVTSAAIGSSEFDSLVAAGFAAETDEAAAPETAAAVTAAPETGETRTQMTTTVRLRRVLSTDTAATPTRRALP